MSGSEHAIEDAGPSLPAEPADAHGPPPADDADERPVEDAGSLPPPPTDDSAGPPPTDDTDEEPVEGAGSLLPVELADAVGPPPQLADTVGPPSTEAAAGLPPAADTSAQPSTGDADGSPSDARRFVLPSIDRVRAAHALRTALRIGTFAVAASVAIAGVAFAASAFNSQYGAVMNEPNAEAWASLSPRFAGQAICTSCHTGQASAQDASAHATVSCEDCHGPAAAHSISAAVAARVTLSSPTSAICITCHGAAAGRPTTFAQVDPATHYAGGECLRCHSPHSIAAVRPPTVTHPLADLPACTTCHNPDGLKKVPSGHELVSDAVCLSCHGRTASGRP